MVSSRLWWAACPRCFPPGCLEREGFRRRVDSSFSFHVTSSQQAMTSVLARRSKGRKEFIFDSLAVKSLT